MSNPNESPNLVDRFVTRFLKVFFITVGIGLFLMLVLVILANL